MVGMLIVGGVGVGEVAEGPFGLLAVPQRVWAL